MRTTTAFFAGAVFFIMLICFCADSPTITTSPMEASSSIYLLPSSSEKMDTVISDSVGKDIQIIVKYDYGYYIDSVHIDIYSDSSFILDGDFDSQLVVRFDEDEVRDSSDFFIRFSTGGYWYLIVRTYKRQGNVSFDTAVATIYSPKHDSNHTPVFMPSIPKQVYYIDSGDSVVFKVYATDNDNDILTYEFTSVTPLPQGDKAYLGPDNTFRWKSKTGDKGIYHIVFRVSDGLSDTTITTTLAIDTTYNSPPLIITRAPNTVFFGTEYVYHPEAVDEQSAILSWELKGSRPAGMDFNSKDGRINWNPESGILTSGPLWLKVTDDGTPSQSDSQYIMITVEGSNRPPEAKSRSVATALETPIKIALFASDSENSALEFAITDPPGNGTAVLSNDSILYTPNPQFQGVDTIKFIALDELLKSSDTATIKIYVATDNQKPIAMAQQLSTREDTLLPLQLLAEDAEDSSLTYKLLKNPHHGTIGNESSDDWLYIPYVNFAGVDSFIFIVNDGQFDSDPATVIVSVTSVNDTPKVSNLGVPTPLNTPVTITLAVSDPDDSVFSYEITRQPSHGEIDTSDFPTLLFTPSTDYRGTDTVLYRVTDTQGSQSAPGRIVILVDSDNTQPIAENGSLTVAEDSSIAFELKGVDDENAPLSFVITNQPKHGELSGTEALRKYQTEDNFWGTDTFSFTVSDGVLVSEPAIMSITVTPVNDPPTATACASRTSGSAPLAIEFTGMGWDTDGDSLIFAWFFSEDSIVTGRNTSYIYDDSGTYIARLTVSDGSGENDSATVTITVKE